MFYQRSIQYSATAREAMEKKRLTCKVNPLTGIKATEQNLDGYKL